MTARFTIDLTEFEQIEAGPGTVLLRVAARAGDDVSISARPTLLVDDGGEVKRLSALSAPDDPTGRLRVAYPVSSSVVVGQDTAFALDFGDGRRVDLPAPTARARRGHRSAATGSVPEAGDALADEADAGKARAQAAALQSELVTVQGRNHAQAIEHAAELERLRVASTAQREAEVGRLHEQLAQQTEHATASTAELQAAAELALAEAAHHRAEAARIHSQLEQSQAAATGAERRAAERAAELERLRDETETAQQALTNAEGVAAEQAAEAEGLRAELERARSETETLSRAAAEAEAAARSGADDLGTRLARHAEQAATTGADLQALVDIASAEAAEHRARADQLTTEVADATARIAALEDQLTHARAEAQQELRTSRRELDSLRHALEHAQVDAEAQTRRAQLKSVKAAAEAQAREADRADMTAARAEPTRSAPRPRPVGPPRGHTIAPGTGSLPRAPGHVGGAATGVPGRIRSSVDAVPAQVVAGLVLVVLGIVIAILFLTGLLG